MIADPGFLVGFVAGAFSCLVLIILIEYLEDKGKLPKGVNHANV